VDLEFHDVLLEAASCFQLRRLSHLEIVLAIAIDIGFTNPVFQSPACKSR
jgi:hypothetical protein